MRTLFTILALLPLAAFADCAPNNPYCIAIEQATTAQRRTNLEYEMMDNLREQTNLLRSLRINENAAQPSQAQAPIVIPTGPDLTQILLNSMQRRNGQ